MIAIRTSSTVSNFDFSLILIIDLKLIFSFISFSLSTFSAFAESRLWLFVHFPRASRTCFEWGFQKIKINSRPNCHHHPPTPHTQSHSVSLTFFINNVSVCFIISYFSFFVRLFSLNIWFFSHSLPHIFMINPKNQKFRICCPTRSRLWIRLKNKLRNHSVPASQCPKSNLNSPSCPATTLVCPAVPCPAPVLRPSPLHLHTLCLKIV